MQYKDLQGKDDSELKALVAENRAQLHELRLKRSMNQLSDVRSIREIRKDIARMLTKMSAPKT
jgi:ribosomal protein L29